MTTFLEASASRTSAATPAIGVQGQGSRRLSALDLAGAILAVLLVLWAAPTRSEAAEHAYVSSFGPDGTESTQFSEPVAIAVDQQTHDIYVGDAGTGSLYKFNENQQPTDFSSLSSNEITGLSFSGSGEGQIAVDSTSHVIFIAALGPGVVKAFKENGEPFEFTEGPDSGSSELGGFSELCGVAVDSAGDIYADDFVGGLTVFSPGGEVIDTFANEFFGYCNLAVNPKGVVYSNKWHAEVDWFSPDSPLPATTSYANEGQVNGNPTLGVAVDPLTEDAYVDEAEQIVRYGGEGGALIETLGASGPGRVHGSTGVAVDGGLSQIYASDNGSAEPRIKVFNNPPPTRPSIHGETTSAISPTEATLSAEINPERADTTYYFEYGASSCALVPDPCASATGAATLDLGSGSDFIQVHQQLRNLTPATRYHYRVVAVNSQGTTEGTDQVFSTYPVPSSNLPDGRAYELVSPGDTGGLTPYGKLTSASILPTDGGVFNYPLASPSGNSVLFYVPSGAIPGLGGSGTGDRYQAVRGSGGWQTHYVGPSGAQAEYPAPGASSSDHSYAFYSVGTNGERGALGSGCSGTQRFCNYIREPNGGFRLIGEGPAATDLNAEGRWISAAGQHQIFTSKVKLTTESPEAGTVGIYDRTPNGLVLVSYLPGDVTPVTDATYRGASTDGSTVAFEVGGTLYARRDNAETYLVSASGATFAGFSQDGKRIFYISSPSTNEGVTEGELETCLLAGGSCSPVKVGAGDQSVVVNVSSDGTALYFVSPLSLTGSEANQNGEHAEEASGRQNLYIWDTEAGLVHFVAGVTEQDVVGESVAQSASSNGLGLWTTAVLSTGGLQAGVADDPSRSTPDGRILVFQSHAKLTHYDNDGLAEVYRYDPTAASGAQMLCLSCNPTNAPAKSDASLEHPSNFSDEAPVAARAEIANVTTDGLKVFFETADPLVAGDTNGLGDVYEWEAVGVGGCEVKSGCVHLISSGHSSRNSYLYGMTPDGHDVFFWTADPLVPEDHNQGVPAIYDAREGGGFPIPAAHSPCQGDSCQGGGQPVPSLAVPGSSIGFGTGNVAQPRHRAHRHKKHHRRHRKHGHKHRRHQKTMKQRNHRQRRMYR